jgi:predicted dehydrogenase
LLERSTAVARKTTRREFVKNAAVLTGAALGPALGLPNALAKTGSHNTLGVAVIGVGGMGGYSLGAALGEKLIAICDIDDDRIAKATKRIHEKQKAEHTPKVYYDYRKLLDECHKDLDAVLIATPDHHHAPAAIRAIHLGKATFCQKPLAHNIRECRTLAEAARKNGVLTQMGNQGHCGEGYRRLVEYIWAGAIGTVTETHSIFARDFGGQGGIPPGKAVPPGVHWDEWLGPAPVRPYHDGLHPFSWRNWRQFGTGTLGDMACHVMDGVFWALKLQQAKTYRIECLSQKNGSAEMFPQSNVLKFEFAARGDMAPVKVFTYDNAGQKPQTVKDLEKEVGRKLDEGTVYVGEKGYLYTDTYGGGLRLLPEFRHNSFSSPARTVARSHGDPIGDLFWAMKNNGTPCSNFSDYSGAFTEMVLTGQLAMFAGPGKVVEWDSVALKCTNNDELNQFVQRRYRKGWEV